MLAVWRVAAAVALVVALVVVAGSPADAHAWAGIARTLLFMAIPFSWLTAIKKKAWR